MRSAPRSTRWACTRMCACLLYTSCLDVGHANTFVSHVPPLEWIAPMAPWLRHVHIHDNAGQMDLHDPLGKGVIQMERVLDEIVRLAPAATFTIENQDCAPSIRCV